MPKAELPLSPQASAPGGQICGHHKRCEYGSAPTLFLQHRPMDLSLLDPEHGSQGELRWADSWLHTDAWECPPGVVPILALHAEPGQPPLLRTLGQWGPGPRWTTAYRLRQERGKRQCSPALPCRAQTKRPRVHKRPGPHSGPSGQGIAFCPTVPRRNVFHSQAGPGPKTASLPHRPVGCATRPMTQRATGQAAPVKGVGDTNRSPCAVVEPGIISCIPTPGWCRGQNHQPGPFVLQRRKTREPQSTGAQCQILKAVTGRDSIRGITNSGTQRRRTRPTYARLSGLDSRHNRIQAQAQGSCRQL